MNITKNDVENWVQFIINDLQGLKDKGYLTSLENNHSIAFGKISMLYQLKLISKDKWEATIDQIFKIAHE